MMHFMNIQNETGPRPHRNGLMNHIAMVVTAELFIGLGLFTTLRQREFVTPTPRPQLL